MLVAALSTQEGFLWRMKTVAVAVFILHCLGKKSSYFLGKIFYPFRSKSNNLKKNNIDVQYVTCIKLDKNNTILYLFCNFLNVHLQFEEKEAKKKNIVLFLQSLQRQRGVRRPRRQLYWEAKPRRRRIEVNIS